MVLVKLGAIAILHRETQQKTMKSRHFIIHEEWNKKRIENDIALIKLPKPVTFTGENSDTKFKLNNMYIVTLFLNIPVC